MHSSFEAVYRNWAYLPLWSDYWERLMKRVLQTRSWKDFLVADHDRYWNLKAITWKNVASQNRSAGQDRLFQSQCRRVWKLQIMMLSFPTAEILHCRLRHGLTRRMRNANIIARISRMVYDAMRWERQGAIGNSSYKFWYSGISCRKDSCCARNLCGNTYEASLLTIR